MQNRHGEALRRCGVAITQGVDELKEERVGRASAVEALELEVERICAPVHADRCGVDE